MSNKRLTTETFIRRAYDIHKGGYSYSKVNYINSRTKVIIVCPIHGEFEQFTHSHLNGYGCRKCCDKEQLKTTEQFIKESKEKHGENTWLYPRTEYVGTHNKLVITCKIHGDFRQVAKVHLNSNGCPNCSKESHWRRSDYIKQARGKICTFYTLRCFNKEEEFYKIGITKGTTKERYNAPSKMPYNYEIVSEIFGEAGSIWDLELQEKRKLKEFNYQPKIKFGGSKSECFTNYE